MTCTCSRQYSPVVTETEPTPEPDVKWLPDVLRSAASEVADATQAPSGMALWGALGAANLACFSGHWSVETPRGPDCLGLMVVLVASTGTGKSSVLRPLVEPVVDWDSSQRDAYVQEKAEWDAMPQGERKDVPAARQPGVCGGRPDDARPREALRRARRRRPCRRAVHSPEVRRGRRGHRYHARALRLRDRGCVP